MPRRYQKLLLALGVVGAIFFLWWIRTAQEHRYDAVILASARRYNLHPALVKAVVWRESRFDHRARGTAGEIGLMQVNRLAADEWAQAEKMRFFSHEQLADPAKNAQAGTWYLRKLLNRYTNTDNPLPYALADYNAGRTNVRRWARGEAQTNSAAFIEAIDFPTTRAYIGAVMERFERYRSAMTP